jgi:hypothetical protein
MRDKGMRVWLVLLAVSLGVLLVALAVLDRGGRTLANVMNQGLVSGGLFTVGAVAGILVRKRTWALRVLAPLLLLLWATAAYIWHSTLPL